MRSAGGTRSTCDSQSRTPRRACSMACRSSSPAVPSAWRIRLDQRRRESGREERQGLVRHPDEPRSQERRGTKVRRRIRQETNERRDVLDLVGVEEPKAFVDVGRDAQRLELAFELAMTRARSKENRDVARSHLSGDPRLLVAYGLVAEGAAGFRARPASRRPADPRRRRFRAPAWWLNPIRPRPEICRSSP